MADSQRTKNCARCHCEKSLDNFILDNRRPDGRGSVCRVCSRAYKQGRECSDADREKRREYNRAYRERAKVLRRDYRKKGPAIACGQIPLSGEDKSRFLSMFDTTADGCWEWKGRRVENGYGVFCAQSNDVYAHRLAFAIHYGPYAPELDACHRCDNPPCVRPDHLFLGTHTDNMRDAKEKGRIRNQWTKGTGNDV